MSSAANCVVNWQKAGGGGGGAAAVSEVEWENYWNPRLYVENAIGELKLTTSRCVKHDGRGLATVCQSQHINGTFFEFMELNKFPFDSQASRSLPTTQQQIDISIEEPMAATQRNLTVESCCVGR